MEITNGKIVRVFDPVAFSDQTIDVSIEVESGDVIRYTAASFSPYEVSRELFSRASKGEYGDVSQSQFYETVAERKALDEQEYRTGVRDSLIREANEICQPLAEEKDLGIITDDDLERYKLWAIYRQKLRRVDISVDDPVWPDRPDQS